ncbi:MAG: DmsE family decaheme c-type cytochrome [Rhodocyclales bacterium]|nr:DmsE family decaheme c-type cytochrome [Rhodocyclales bacterium]
MKLSRYAAFLWCVLVGAAGIGSVAQAAGVTPGVAKPAASDKDLILKGDAKCTGCHDEADEPTGRATMLELNPGVLAIATTRHGVKGDSRTPSCVNCHGDSEKHVGHKGKGKPPAPDRSFRKATETPAVERNDACLTCHKGDQRTHWEGSQHANNDVACNSCHKIHGEHDKVRNKKTQAEVCFTCHKAERTQTHRVSTHPLAAGKMACSDCHNLHGSAGPKMLKKNTLNETCFTCHAEKRGPFLWEHQPVAEDCSSCHTPHGSNISPLLKSRAPFMCSECHDGPHNSKAPYGPVAAGNQAGFTGTNPTENAGGRGCMNCHSMIHGSNHPAGALLHR